MTKTEIKESLQEIASSIKEEADYYSGSEMEWSLSSISESLNNLASSIEPEGKTFIVTKAQFDRPYGTGRDTYIIKAPNIRNIYTFLESFSHNIDISIQQVEDDDIIELPN